eukprot:403355009
MDGGTQNYQSIDGVLNDNYQPNYQRYAPRFKPYSLEEIETEKNTVYPFRKPQAPIENTYVNYLPHDPQMLMNTPMHYPYPYQYQYPYNYDPMSQLGQNMPLNPNIYPSHFIAQERQKSYLDSLKRQQLDLKLKIEVEKLEQAKKLLEAEVYNGLKKTVKKEVKRQKRDLNDKNDLEMMDVVKRHQDHLQNLGEGIDDNHIWLLVRENDIQNKKVEEIGLAHDLRERRKNKERQQEMKKLEQKMQKQRLQEMKQKQRQMQKLLEQANEADDESPQSTHRNTRRVPDQNNNHRKSMQQIQFLGRNTSNPTMQPSPLKPSYSQQKIGTSYSKKSAYAGVAPQFAPHPHYYPPFPLPDEGDQFYFPPLS